ncbi:hypothetical protein BSQ40_13650 [Serratia fonticola]|nr:hypothetical protein BSQ40_13650 [Serratia fonticola]
MQERLSALLVLFIGVMGILLIFPLVGNYMVSLNFPSVVSFNRLGTYIISAWPVSVLLIIIGGYSFFTGDKDFIRFKMIAIWSYRITMLGMIVATLFNWHFTTALGQHGYGICWKKSIYGETLYIKDVSECKKRGTQVLKRPRAVYRR